MSGSDLRGRLLIKLFKSIELMGRPQGAAIDELAEALDVDRRSVYRHFKVIEDLGIPIYDDKEPDEPRKRWRILDSYVRRMPGLSLPDIRFTLSEIISLYALKGESRVFQGTEIERHVETAFHKVGMFVPEDLARRLQRIRALFVVNDRPAKNYQGKEEVIERLTEAILARKTCQVTYHTFQDDTVKTYPIDPLHFFEHGETLYLFVRTPAYGHIRTLAVERIQDLEMTEAGYEYPEGFDPVEKLRSAFHIVYDDPITARIRFSADQARYVKERIWADEQTITDQPDGSVILDISTSGRWELKRWVLSFGADAAVLEPADFRDEVRQEADRMQRTYNS